MKRLPVTTFVMLAIGGALVVAFLAHLLGRGLHRFPEDPRWSIPGANAERGRVAIIRYGCSSCHVIPGIRQATGRVGPKLEDFADQGFIAGMLPNTPENLVRWIQHPREINPGTAMPTLGLSEQEAHDIAAYIYENP